VYAVYNEQHITVKPLMLAYPLFHEPDKTVKLKGANINYIATLTTLMLIGCG